MPKLYILGEFWIDEINGHYYRFWYDAAARQTRRRSLGATDLRQAKERLEAWWITNARLSEARPEDVPLATVLLRYWEQHGQHVRSFQQQDIALGYWTEFYGAELVSGLTPQRQEEFVGWLRKKGHGDNYISRTLSVGRAALRRALQRQELRSAPFIKDVFTGADRRDVEPKGRPLSIEEMARLFNAAKSEHVFRFLLLMANTLARPDAALDFRPAVQYDAEHGLLDLNPPGRRQTKKYRPVVPATATLRPWLTVDAQTCFVNHRGRQIASIKTGWRTLRVAASFTIPHNERNIPDLRIQPYSIRHTIARELRKAGVPGEQISLFLGHLPQGAAKTTAIYAPYSPGYCGAAVKAIDDYMRALQKLVARQFVLGRRRAVRNRSTRARL